MWQTGNVKCSVRTVFTNFLSTYSKKYNCCTSLPCTLHQTKSLSHFNTLQLGLSVRKEHVAVTSTFNEDIYLSSILTLYPCLGLLVVL